jgi:hypothetical protein
VPFSLRDDDDGPRKLASAEDLRADHADDFRADDDDDRRLSDISADDPDVGVVYDDEDDVEVEVGADGKVRRRRRGRLQVPAWYRSEVARRIFRFWWAPVAGALIVLGVAGYFFNQEWQAARQESERKNRELAAQAAREAARFKPPPKPVHKPLPPGRLEVATRPPGADVWVDGVEKGRSPLAIDTQPGSHRLVITMPGYRMLRDAVSTHNGAHIERDLLPVPRVARGGVPLTVVCATQNKYPVFIDGQDTGMLCPLQDVEIDPGRHVIGIFVIPQNRIWTFQREVQAGRPHRVQFNY